MTFIFATWPMWALSIVCFINGRHWTAGCSAIGAIIIFKAMEQLASAKVSGVSYLQTMRSAKFVAAAIFFLVLISISAMSGEKIF